MAFQLSPGVLVVEKDLTNVVPAVATSIGGFVGDFQWGPINEPITISSEVELVKTFGKPNETTFTSFFSAANFLSYSNNLKVVRASSSVAKNAVASGTAVLIKNETDWDANYAAGEATVGEFAAKYAGRLGNSLRVSMADSATFEGQTLTGTATVTLSGTTVTGSTTAFDTELVVGSILTNASGTVVGTVSAIASATSLTLAAGAAVALSGEAVKANWQYAAQFDGAPGVSSYVSSIGGSNDEMHIIVIDEDGLITGTEGTVLEKFSNISKARDAKSDTGASNYYKEVLRGSRYIWWMDHTADGTNWGSDASSTAFASLSSAVTVSLTGGVNPSPADSDLQTGWDELSNPELVDVNLLIVGPHSSTVAAYVVDIAVARLDCIAFVSPELADVYNNAGSEATDVVGFHTALNKSTSYAVMDSGWKYQYDKYADKYRWVPLNADIAGLCARTDAVADPWFSPGGLNRGQIRNVVKLAWSPSKADRDTLYKKGINPVVSFPGEGTVLFGDKTLLSKPSAFDRINVRRLFIVLEKAIALAAKYQLFEFNDAFTRAQFRNLVEPFLRDIKGRRGIYDFRVICDETNNTGDVIDRNEFVADIFIKPARSINFITLNFVATRTGVAFEEVAGA